MAQRRFTLSLGKTEATHVLEAITQTAARQKGTLGITNEPLTKVAVRLAAALAEPEAATPVVALIGENGPEVVAPLRKKSTADDVNDTDA